MVNSSLSLVDASFSEEPWLDGLVVSEPVASQMALSTLLLRDIQHQHRRNQQLSRNTTLGGMPEIQESPDEDNHVDPVKEATAALSAAVKNLATGSRTVNPN